MSDTSYNPIPEQALKSRYWFLTHGSVLDKARLYPLIGINVILWLFVLGSLFNLYGLNLLRYPRSLRAMASPAFTTHTQIAPAAPLTTTEIGVLPTGGDQADLYALLQNTNSQWRATFEYAFTINGRELSSATSYLYPRQSRYLLDLAIPNAVNTQPRIIIKNIQWDYVSPATQEQIDFDAVLETSNTEYLPATSSLPLTRLKTTVTNPTGLPLGTIQIPIVLKNGSSIVAAQYTTIEELGPKESKDIEVRWLENLPPVNSYSIEPHIDIFDPNSFTETEKEPLSPQNLR